MTIKSGPTIPERFHDLLGSAALAHVATIGPRGEPQSSPDPYEYHGPCDERGVIFVRAEHTTQKDG